MLAWLGGQVLDEDERHAGIGGQSPQQPREGLQAARRSPDGHHRALRLLPVAWTAIATFRVRKDRLRVQLG